jgi:hypothetical protein
MRQQPTHILADGHERHLLLSVLLRCNALQVAVAVEVFPLVLSRHVALANAQLQLGTHHKEAFQRIRGHRWGQEHP